MSMQGDVSPSIGVTSRITENCPSLYAAAVIENGCDSRRVPCPVSRVPFPVSRFPLYIRRRTLRGDPTGISPQPSAPAEPKRFLSDVLDVFNVLHEPDAVFTRVKERARILAPWIVFSVAFIVISILTQPYQQAAMEAFKATLTLEQAARMGNRGAGGGVVGLVLTPAFV